MQPVPHIPGHELLKFLGGGPLTMVYLARDCAADRICALKLLRPEWQDQATGIKLMQREARAGLTVRHPHLVRLLDVHVTRPPYYLVMELLPGESLRRRLRRDYRLDAPTALWVARQTAEALAALHRAGFIHGDVKPENVRVVDAGTAKLLDLGFAHRPGENADLVARGYVLGTLDYLAPELCAFDPDADQRTDLFSLGVMLFEMLTGTLPYPAGSVEQTLRRHRSDPPADLRRFGEEFPPGLAGLVGRLLSHRPWQRPRAAAVVQQLVALEIAALGRRAG
jgi:eukaryotic-like serine/threonine-protein kinase